MISARATALAVPLLLLALLVALVSVRLSGDRLVVTRRALAGEPQTFDGWRPAAAGAMACVVLSALVLPIVVLTREARHVSSWISVVTGSGDAIRNSLTLAALGATAVCALAFWLGYARARATRVVGVAADVLFIVLFAVPGTIVGVALIGLWNRAGVAGAIYATNGMFLLVYLARFTPLAALAVAASLRRVPASHQEAAAGERRGLVSDDDSHRPSTGDGSGLLAVWVIVFTLAFGELGASVLVTPPGESTLPIRIYTLIANAPPAQVAALALLQVAVIFCPLAVIWNRSGRAKTIMTAALLRLVGVTKVYGARAVVQNLSLDVAAGESIALLGPSGSGKTTVLRLIAGLERPDAGEIWIDSRQMTTNGRQMVPAYERRVGLVFQDLALWPHLTVRDNLAFVVTGTSPTKVERAARVEHALAVCRVDSRLADRYPHELSGGEQQRVALARAIAGSPRVLLLDEPFSSLDAELRATLRRELADLQRQLGLTTIYVTHDVEDASALATRAVVMRDGRIETTKSTSC